MSACSLADMRLSGRSVCQQPGTGVYGAHTPLRRGQGSTLESDLEALEARRVKQLTRLEPTAGQSLGMMADKEAVDSLLVFRKAVWPEIEAHQLARRPQL